jgi:hypothetical protein
LETLGSASRRDRLLRVERLDGLEAVEGLVEAVGSEWLLVRQIVDCEDNGLIALRVADVSGVAPLAHRRFMRRALELRGRWQSSPPAISLGSTKSLLRSAAQTFPLLTVHEERHAPDVWWIGALTHAGARAFELRKVSPGAKWAQEATSFRSRRLTRLDIGGRYERTLLMVAGWPPHRS